MTTTHKFPVQVVQAVEKLALVQRSLVHECMAQLEELMAATLPLPPSPASSSEEDKDEVTSSAAGPRLKGRSSSFPQLTPAGRRTLFGGGEEAGQLTSGTSDLHLGTKAALLL